VNNIIKIYRTYLGLSLFFLLSSLVTQAQRDTSRKQTIDINSAYKPVLREAVKLNFSASHLPADTSKMIAPYLVPVQQLFFAPRASPLRPLALLHDSLPALGTRNFLKGGLGNYSTPYLGVGISIGNGLHSLLNIYGDYISSVGAIKNQDFSRLNLKAAGSLFSSNHEYYGNVSLSQEDYHYYGYDHSQYTFTKEDVLQRLQLFQLKAGLRNKTHTGSGIYYNPQADIRLFSNPGKCAEQSLVITAPIEKTFGQDLRIRLSAHADLTSYKADSLQGGRRLTNHVYSFAPAITYTKPSFNLHLGATPSWNNGNWVVLPVIYGEARLKNRIFFLQAGVVGRIIKNTFQHLTSLNPWLRSPDATQFNTKETEIYGGIKANIGDHLTINSKASWITSNNLPLYVNDTLDGKTFTVINEGSISNFRIQGDISFIKQEKFTITGGLTFNGFNGLRDQKRAWGLIPLELTASLRWWAFKQVLLKGDFRAFNGIPTLRKDGTDFLLGGGADLSAGLEFQLNKKFTAWTAINNLFNSRYQRWRNYPVYGINFLAGVIYRF